MKASIKKITKKYRWKLKKAILNVNYHLERYRQPIWLIGDGRSGTTWVSDLINFDGRYREMFEPYHPRLVPGMEFLKTHKYYRPEEFDGEIYHISKSIFNGNFYNERVDMKNTRIFYSGLLVKDIFANLLSYSVFRRISNMKIILLMRNPFSVALSKRKRSNWYWETDPLKLLSQKNLYDDYLYKFEDIIIETAKKDSFLLNQILIWSIINYVPIMQFEEGDLYICHYEDVVNDARKEIININRFIYGDSGVVHNIHIPEETIMSPSMVSNMNRRDLSKEEILGGWVRMIPQDVFSHGMNVLKEFGLDRIYDKNMLPITNSIVYMKKMLR